MQEGAQKDIHSIVSSYNRDELEEKLKVQASKINVPYFDVRTLEIPPDVLSLVSKEEASRGVLPLGHERDTVILGVANQQSLEAKDIAKNLSRFFKVKLGLISWEAIKDTLPKYDGLVKQNLEKREDYEVAAYETALTFEELGSQINSAPLQNILSFIVTSAIQSKSSDIHLEPEKVGARIRFRIDGVLHVVGHLEEERFKYVLSQVELASGMKLNEKEAQQGRLEIKLPGKNISVRVETMPTLYGDDISLRIFNTDATMLYLDDLGLAYYDLGLLSSALARPQGMILVVGPTGAGKTSTIYASLNVLNKPEVKIITLEDPVEYALTGIAQSQINEGESFNERLKAVLREDPDIVMLGEIRDAETADVALHAALTGHVMISTFHAYNAATAISLLKEISTNNSLLAAAINLIVAQRLVRRLCPDCKQQKVPTLEEQKFVDSVLEKIPNEIKEGKVPKFFESKGCNSCHGLGYSGRIGIYEMLPMKVEYQKLIAREDVTVQELQDAAQKSGMITMEADGVLKAMDGITTLSEIMKVIKE